MRALGRCGAAALAAVLAAGLLAAGCGKRGTDPAFISETDAWHADRVARLATNTGWLTLVGLHPLSTGRHEVGSGAEATIHLPEKAPAVIGAITVDAAGKPSFVRHAGADVRREDALDAVLDSCRLDTDADGMPTVLVCGSLNMYVIARGDRLFLRVKDAEAEALRSFSGIERYPVDAAWRVTARLEPGPAMVTVPNVLGQNSQEPSPGVLVFRLDGITCRLTPTGALGKDLFIVFSDPTNGEGSYPGGRFLYADAPARDGTVVLDFNRAVNPPCAFSEYATCPLPPEHNRLPVPVTAGEKRYGSGHAH